MAHDLVVSEAQAVGNGEDMVGRRSRRERARPAIGRPETRKIGGDAAILVRQSVDHARPGAGGPSEVVEEEKCRAATRVDEALGG
jgi:hypothetical protein